MYRRTIEGKTEEQQDKKLEKKLKCYYDHPEFGLSKGQQVSNPSAELITAEGWEHYEPVPPVPPPPVPQTEPNLDDVIKAMIYLHEDEIAKLPDDVAAQCKSLFPTWVSKIGSEVKKGFRLYYDEHLYETTSKVFVAEDETPDKSSNYTLIG